MGGGEVECVHLLLRVGACADELRLMRCERGSIIDGVTVAADDSTSAMRKASSACAPSAMERIWRGPCGEGARCTVHSVARGGRRRARRRAMARRFAVTKGCRECEGTCSFRLVIDTISKPRWCCSSASPKVHVSGSQRTRNSSTHVDRRPFLTRHGSERASMWYMAALSPGTSLSLSGSTVLRVSFVSDILGGKWSVIFAALAGPPCLGMGS